MKTKIKQKLIAGIPPLIIGYLILNTMVWYIMNSLNDTITYFQTFKMSLYVYLVLIGLAGLMVSTYIFIDTINTKNTTQSNH